MASKIWAWFLPSCRRRTISLPVSLVLNESPVAGLNKKPFSEMAMFWLIFMSS